MLGIHIVGQMPRPCRYDRPAKSDMMKPCASETRQSTRPNKTDMKKDTTSRSICAIRREKKIKINEEPQHLTKESICELGTSCICICICVCVCVCGSGYTKSMKFGNHSIE